MPDRMPVPMIFGGFAIGYTDELAASEVENVYYFGRDMVLFCIESGEIGLTDCYSISCSFTWADPPVMRLLS